MKCAGRLERQLLRCSGLGPTAVVRWVQYDWMDTLWIEAKGDAWIVGSGADDLLLLFELFLRLKGLSQFPQLGPSRGLDLLATLSRVNG